MKIYCSLNVYMNYFDRYIKYKYKYNKFNKRMDSEYNFYFIHMTKNFKNIIKTGYLKLGSDIPVKHKNLSGYVDEPYVFANIYFEDLDNLEWFCDLSLIIKPEIINSQIIQFIGGWGNLLVTEINPQETKSEKIIKINEFKEYIINPYGLPDILLQAPKYRQHEVRFTSPINLHQYLDGVVIYYGNEDELVKKVKRIKKLLKKYNFENIKIYSSNKKILINA